MDHNTDRQFRGKINIDLALRDVADVIREKKE